VWPGQYAGIGALVAVAVAAALGLAGVTIADGADNIAVCTPLFRSLRVPAVFVTIGAAVLVPVFV
jgi:cadmium resistance protein CadD (predicted permease)